MQVVHDAPLRNYTRFELGGPARRLIDAESVDDLRRVLELAKAAGEPYTVIGGGSNLVVSDEGYPGTVIRYADASIAIDGNTIRVGAGAILQNLVDASIAANLEGLHTLTRIPGWVGGAVYGNAGAYGHSMHEFVNMVSYLDTTTGASETIDNAGCQFRYRESLFKQRKHWIILSTTLRLPDAADPDAIRAEADRIRKIRDEKFPPTLRCAGSIFKNLMLADLPADVQAQVPPNVVREGKVASAFFLEKVGAKGMREGGIQVADYHANLLYNASDPGSGSGEGTAAQVRTLIATLKQRVAETYGIHLEEEVQFI